MFPSETILYLALGGLSFSSYLIVEMAMVGRMPFMVCLILLKSTSVMDIQVVLSSKPSNSSVYTASQIYLSVGDSLWWLIKVGGLRLCKLAALTWWATTCCSPRVCLMKENFLKVTWPFIIFLEETSSHISWIKIVGLGFFIPGLKYHVLSWYRRRPCDGLVIDGNIAVTCVFVDTQEGRI